MSSTSGAPGEVFGKAIMEMAEQLALHSDEEGSLTCAYLTPAHRASAQQLRNWMQSAGMQAVIDDVGNVVGRLPCGRPDAKTLITGSHYDTVRNGGKYDGRLGILLPIVIASWLRDHGLRLDFDLEIIAFAEEEGVRFKSTFLGSNAIIGAFDAAVLDQVDADGTSMREAMRGAGLDPANIPALARDPTRLLGFLEVHIEQGPVLLQSSLPVGIVTSIAGNARFMIELEGTASHAGTTPMSMRRDAAAAAAEMVLAIERRCAAGPTGSGLVGTVGQLQVPQGSINVIPAACHFSIDLRAAADAVRDAAVEDVLAQLHAIAARRNIGMRINKIMQVPAVPCAPHLMASVEAAVERAGVTPLRLPSGAGHDAMTLARITDVAMLFVRCGNGGISHNPKEIMTAGDAEVAAQIFLDVLQHIEPNEA